MHIQVLGSGCPSCKRLFETTQQAVQALELHAEVEYLTGDQAMQKIIELGVLSSPVLVIDDQVALIGANHSVDQLKQILQEEQSPASACCEGGQCDCATGCACHEES